MEIFINTIYEIVVLSIFLFSIYLLILKKRAKQQYHFYIYISGVFITDLIFSRIKKEYPINSNYIFFFFILTSYAYFYYFFLRNFRAKLYKNIWTATFAVFFILTLIFQIKNSFIQFNTVTIVLLPLFYIIGSMGWFSYILKQDVKGNIFNKMAFWISNGLLIWSVFFLFRGLPMYYFNNSDPDFLKGISMIFTLINILTYVLFFRSLFCKQ